MNFRQTFLVACLALLAGIAQADLPDAQRFSVVLETGNVAQARAWLDEGLDPNFEGNLIGTGLMIGAWYGNIPLMELFWTRGADLQQVNRFGETALMLAAWKNQRDAMRWLLRRNAQPNRPDREWSPLHYAAFAGNADLVDDLLKAGADVNARSTNGSTVVMMAAREGHVALAQRLLAAGANPAIKNDFEENAVDWAMKYSHYDIAKTFTGADNFAELARNAANYKPPKRSIAAPDNVEEYLRMARLAEARGKRSEAFAAYKKALAALKTQEANDAKAKTTAGKTAPPGGLVISAKRAKPEQQTMSFTRIPDISSAPPSEVDRLLANARAAEAAGRRQEALRLYRLASDKIKQARE